MPVSLSIQVNHFCVSFSGAQSYYRETGAKRFHARTHGSVDPIATKAILTTAMHSGSSSDPGGGDASPSSAPPSNGIIYLEDELVELPFGRLGPHPGGGGGKEAAREGAEEPPEKAAKVARAPEAAAAAAVVAVYGTP